MRLTLKCVFLTLAIAAICWSQQWELGGTGGYGWSLNPSISSPIQPARAEAGFRSQAAIGAIFAQNMYEYVGGEIRYLFQFGGPQLQFGGTKVSMSGYSNAITYDVMIHLASRDSRFRPFFSGGAGIKVYTGSGFVAPGQPLVGYALLRPLTQVEPAIAVGSGVKYRFAKHAQFRAEFRANMTPTPNDVIRPTGLSAIHGWIFDLVPQLGVSYVF
jgi:hypothetical protein